MTRSERATVKAPETQQEGGTKILPNINKTSPNFFPTTRMTPLSCRTPLHTTTVKVDIPLQLSLSSNLGPFHLILGQSCGSLSVPRHGHHPMTREDYPVYHLGQIPITL